MGTITALGFWVPVVRREGIRPWGRNWARFRGWSRNGSRFPYRLNGVQLYWDQLPNSTRVGVAVTVEVYLGNARLVAACKSRSGATTHWRAITVRRMMEVPGIIGPTPEKAETV
jgi:hypothetical protein